MALSKIHGLIVAAALSAASVHAASAQTLLQPTAPVAKAPSAPKPPGKLVYLTPDLFPRPDLLLPTPPKPETPEAQGELAAVKAIQAAATPARIAMAAADDENKSVWFYSDVLPGFVKGKLPLTEKLFKATQNDEDIEADTFKKFFARIRPFDVDHSIKTCVASTYGSPRSYPSGHATLGYGQGVILARLIPEKAGVILARAKIYAENRVICGVHFPSDLTASQVIATAAALEFLRNPEFKKDFDAAKAELAAAGLTKPPVLAANR